MSSRTAEFASAILIGVLVGVFAGAYLITMPYAASDDCLTQPTGDTPQGQHWFYRIERGSKRHCWYLRSEADKPARVASSEKSPKAASRKQDPQFFKDGGWDFERKYSIRSVVADRYVSILRDDYMDTHGAHPNSDVNTVLWDKSESKRISIRPFFTETADNGTTIKAMVRAVIASLKIEKKKRDSGETATDEWFKGVEPSLLKIGAVTLAPSTEAGKSSGLTFHYPPYAVGPYAEGQYVAFVPWETLKSYLTPEGARVFGGARPKGDADEQQ